ncbi:hypothetical protein BD309DRAFT_248639 [Dichomitus squalens]|nr:hypothetical protein BD309DRAFT_248639 [Dichomitus squalens]
MCSTVFRRFSCHASPPTNHVIYVASLVLALFSFPRYNVSPFSRFCSLAVAAVTHRDSFLFLPSTTKSDRSCSRALLLESPAPTDPIWCLSGEHQLPWRILGPQMPHCLKHAPAYCSTIISKNVSTSYHIY